MAKVCELLFPMGSYKGQRSPGFYMHDTLKDNLDVLLKNIKRDWDFVITISGSGRVRMGKCQPKGSKVLMSNGEWKNVEDVKVGDKVISPNLLNKNYSYSKVKETTNYFSPDNYTLYNKQHNEKMYSCSGNHLIPIKILKPIRKTIDGKRITTGYESEIKNMTAEELYKKKAGWFRRTNTSTFQGFYIDKFEGSINPKIEPYSLGYFLGDGSFHSSVEYIKNSKKEKCNVKAYSKTIKKTGQVVNYNKQEYDYDYKPFLKYSQRGISITSETIESMKYICDKYSPINIYQKKNTNAKQYNFSFNGKFAKELIKIGLEGKGSGTKFIPKEVKIATSDYRMKVLAGIIDSDGYVNKSGYISITTKSQQLAKDICEIVKSLGGSSNIRKIRKGIKRLNFIGDYFCVKVNLRERQKDIPLINKFKKKRLKNLAFNFGERFYIKKEKSQEVYGITLDSESQLYITDNYYVTHNSLLGIQIAVYWNYMIEQLYGIKNPFTIKDNIVFNGSKLIKMGNMLGTKYKYSALIFDEAGADLEGVKAMKRTTQAVKDFLRECGQYNLLTILVLPEFFDLPRGIALSRCDFLINCYTSVTKDDYIERGYFNFYSRPNKKYLFLRGKKELNYNAYPEDWSGTWDVFYPIDEVEYRAAKVAALKARESLSAKEERMKTYLKGCFTYMKALGMSHTEIAEKVKDIMNFPTSHHYISRTLGLEKEEDDD